MKLLKPTWVSHGGKAIYAVDIHPDSSRFATGGQGEDTGLVVIWNIAPVASEIHEEDENVPKMLCQIDDHTACVNCLRWSNNGKYLASGGDDNIVMLWGLSRMSGGSTVFGTGGSVVNIENWKCAHILRGHSGDVLDVAWSPDDSYLATGSVDNTIIVWNGLKLPEILHTIKDHQGLVKGVTFDPVGKYLASQSDDKTLRIWNTSDWKLEKQITEPFTESSGTTHVLRLNWSPDGQYVVSAHAMNNGGPVAKIIERNGWKSKMDFVGHRKAITCVRFNSRLFCESGSTKSQYVCCAVGSRDASLSVWLTSLKRPLVVVHKLFDSSVMDMSWSKCGYFLAACSLDGTVAFMDFSKEELGQAMSTEDKFIYHKKTYGTSIKASKSLILSSIVENPDFLKHQQQQQLERVKKAKLLKQKLLSSSNGEVSPVAKNASTPFKADGKHMGGLMSTSSNEKMESTEILKKQKEVKTKEGKRKIIPMMIELPPDFGNDNGSAFVDFEAEKAFDEPMEQSFTGASQDLLASLSVKPLSVSGEKATSKKTEEPAKSSSSTTSTSIAVKRKMEITDTPPSKKSKKKKDKDKEKIIKDVTNTPVKGQSDKASEQAIVRYESQVHIPYPEVENKLSLQVSLTSFKPTETKANVEVENNLQDTSTASSRHYLRCVIEENLSWETCLTSPVTALAANPLMVCVSCQNKSVHVFTPKGRRSLPALIMDGYVSQLQCHKQYLMVLTSSGSINVWNIKTKSAVVKNESLLSLLKGSEQSISRSFVNDRGNPVIILSDHTAYSFDADLCTWVLLASGDDQLQLSADIGSCMTSSQPKGLLHSVQAPLQRLSKGMMKGLRLNPTKQQTSSFSYLESQVAAALSLNSPEEYHFWLMTYTRYIVQSGEENRLRDLCEELLGPASKQGTSTWQKNVLCYDKRDLLKDMLPIIASNLRFQRFYTEFQQQLEALPKR